MSNDKPIFIRQEILQQTINDLEEKKAELLETIRILDDYKKSYTLTEFFDILSKLKVKST